MRSTGGGNHGQAQNEPEDHAEEASELHRDANDRLREVSDGNERPSEVTGNQARLEEGAVVTHQMLGEIATKFNKEHGELFEIWEVNMGASQDELNQWDTWLLKLGSMFDSEIDINLLLMGDFGITPDSYKATRSERLAQIDPKATVDQIVEELAKFAAEYYVPGSVHDS